MIATAPPVRNHRIMSSVSSSVIVKDASDYSCGKERQFFSSPKKRIFSQQLRAEGEA